MPCCTCREIDFGIDVSVDNNHLIASKDPTHPANLICELCRLFYTNGWCTGTGGGVSIRDANKAYIAPSGVHKERMVPSDMFVMDLESKEYLRKPAKYKASACTPLFLDVYNIRDSGACIHTHSQNAVMVTLLFDKYFEISSIEQIKALPKVTEAGNLWYSDRLTIPILENTEREEDLSESLQQCIKNHPNTTAVLVRRHGIFVWGENIWKAKVYNEALDYLMELAIKMKQFGIPTVKQE
ncbi:hypothetical protein KL905_003799 [Ogataea polymorpha]|uniref:Methylthioribulose-1-phosphate dehydratase n=1 Tax=Ogataea polymorpha TaxID=460523 RepID=A0A9P8P3F9_9ASCO|nr:hypothetical protein KL937_004102 [Ogataea polymorpha]KAG7890123.1 hypothetical protein KL908_004461 [Ogataea polymorpha]KAG7907180.1 hypothetical protein KL906_004366 [Ogataea polymorpha]KAG7918788.1 hypothetical protein KL905_003799 [Ogataea polymorpha]KAG7933228.1 hypothetical protein KL904_004284 [Ogataea polymorpha]